MFTTDDIGAGRRVWFDVEDLFHYARENPRPSGIQRVGFEVCRAMQLRYGAADRVRFVRHTPDGRSLIEVEWRDLEALFQSILELPAEDRPGQETVQAQVARQTLPPSPARVQGRTPLRSWLRRIVHVLPARFRIPLVLFLVLQTQSGLALARLGLATLVTLPALLVQSVRGAGTRPLHDPRSAGTSGPAGAEAAAKLEHLARPGDVLIVLGSPWFHDGYRAIVDQARDELGMRFAILVHDIIPLRRPEWCDLGVNRTFRNWLLNVLPACDTIFSNSRATAADLERYASEHGIALPGPVEPLPIGASFGFGKTASGQRPTAPLPGQGTYVLCVSTIEARKNHALLFRVWRRLIDDLPRERVPTLVLAGRVGWLVADLMQQLENANYLDGKIVLARDPSDADLLALYKGCLFTVFPSFYEGWGLPVTESLSLGKPCIASNRTSLPEAGGAFARYLDPEDVGASYRVIRGTIEDRAALAAWQERIEREFRPLAWEDTAAAIMRRVA